jgi:sigma-B regulation protein RsbU (phosphoserine phosphatase)
MFYTDGVTEAFSAEDEIFGDERLLKILSELDSATADEILDKIMTEVNLFIGDFPVSDDITLIALKRENNL